MNVDDTTMKALVTSMNYRKIRQELISSNIANAETPGFKAKRVDFEAALARAIDLDKEQTMKVSDPKHFNVGGGSFENLQPELYDDPNGIVSEDGNTVDRDNELALMAKNKILFDASVQLLNKKLGMMKYAISGQ